MSIDDKLKQLRDRLQSYGSCLVAYSGGVDSVFLAQVAHQVLGERCLAVLADSASLPRRELVDAQVIAEKFGIPLRVIKTREFDNPDYLSNPQNRCYFCKHELFTELRPIAENENFAVIAYGENASDIGDFRPGAAAAAKFQIRSPLKEVGLLKTEIRQLSARMNLPTADKPQMACLSSRVPYGERVTPEKLRMIEQGEDVLRDLGFIDVRVRHHELKQLAAAPALSPAVQHLARIEVGVEEMSKFWEEKRYQMIADALRKIGYDQVTLDLQGYRRGSLNAALSA